MLRMVLLDPRILCSQQREMTAPRETGAPLVLLATMDLMDSLAFLAHPAPLAPLALAETTLLK